MAFGRKCCRIFPTKYCLLFSCACVLFLLKELINSDPNCIKDSLVFNKIKNDMLIYYRSTPSNRGKKIDTVSVAVSDGEKHDPWGTSFDVAELNWCPNDTSVTDCPPGFKRHPPVVSSIGVMKSGTYRYMFLKNES